MRASLGPLASRNFRLLLACDVISVLGSAMAGVALPFAFLAIGGSASDIGYVSASSMVAMMAFLLFGGAVADRLPRHQVIVAAGVLMALAQGAAATLVLTGHARAWELAAHCTELAPGRRQTSWSSPSRTARCPCWVPAHLSMRPWP